MSWWKKVVEFFTGPTPEAPEEPAGSTLEAATWSAIRARMQAQTSFTPGDIATDVWKETGSSKGPPKGWSALLDEFFERGLFTAHSYVRTKQQGAWIYHRKGQAPLASPPLASSPPFTSAPVASPPMASQSMGKSAPQSGKAKATKAVKDPYDVGAILSLGKEELRARALQIIPWRTAWIGRVDVIPPESDERTALIDRGLELRGLLSRAQITEIHRIGDLWLRHKDGARLAESVAAKNVEEALAQARIQKQLAKEEKKRVSVERAAQRATEIQRRKREDITYLGRGVSFGLSDRRSHVEKLKELGLPQLSSPADLAKALGLSVPTLRGLAFHAEATRTRHYVTFEVPKRSGGTRQLSSPLPRMKAAQAWILEHILEKLPTESPAHGFIAGRSTVTNARPHAGKPIVVNQDLVDFFPTITFGRVRGVFLRIGYSPAVATVLALLTTEAPRQEAKYAGTTYWVALGPRSLPQGACTSPALSNQIAVRLDRRLLGLANKRGFVYTRYADDLSFSGGVEMNEKLAPLLASVRHVVEEEGFSLHLQKGRVQRKGGRRTVTGIVVNEPHKLAVPREEIRKLRAILHNAKKTGLAAQNREGHPHFEAWLRGKIAYVSMIDRPRGEQLRAAFAALK
jgi:RNA-directed DNA polymerase